MGPVGAQSSIVHEQQVAISVGGDVSFEKATLRFGWIDSSLQSRGVVREGALERSPRRKAASSDCRAEIRVAVDRLPYGSEPPGQAEHCHAAEAPFKFRKLVFWHRLDSIDRGTPVGSVNGSA